MNNEKQALEEVQDQFREFETRHPLAVAEMAQGRLSQRAIQEIEGYMRDKRYSHVLIVASHACRHDAEHPLFKFGASAMKKMVSMIFADMAPEDFEEAEFLLESFFDNNPAALDALANHITELKERRQKSFDSIPDTLPADFGSFEIDPD